MRASHCTDLLFWVLAEESGYTYMVLKVSAPLFHAECGPGTVVRQFPACCESLFVTWVGNLTHHLALSPSSFLFTPSPNSTTLPTHSIPYLSQTTITFPFFGYASEHPTMHFPLLAHNPNSNSVIGAGVLGPKYTAITSAASIPSSSHFTCLAHGLNEGSSLQDESQSSRWGLRSVMSRWDNAAVIVCCQVAGGVSIEPDRKTVGPVFSYAFGAITSRKFGCVVSGVSVDAILMLMRGSWMRLSWWSVETRGRLAGSLVTARIRQRAAPPPTWIEPFIGPSMTLLYSVLLGCHWFDVEILT